MLVSRGGPAMMARIGVMRALNRHVERVFNAERKDIRWEAEAEQRPLTVRVDTSEEVSDPALPFLDLGLQRQRQDSEGGLHL
jgi:hypothetical protein